MIFNLILCCFKVEENYYSPFFAKSSLHSSSKLVIDNCFSRRFFNEFFRFQNNFKLNLHFQARFSRSKFSKFLARAFTLNADSNLKRQTKQNHTNFIFDNLLFEDLVYDSNGSCIFARGGCFIEIQNSQFKHFTSGLQ